MGTDHKVCASCGYVIDGATRESYEAEIERLRGEELRNWEIRNQQQILIAQYVAQNVSREEDETDED